MRVRLRIKAIKGEGGEAEVAALVNSGFETETPQLLIPRRLAETLGLWPPPPESRIVEFGTAGGPIRNYMIPSSLEVRVLAGDRESRPIICDAIISHIEEEVLINDKLGEELGIMIIGIGSGKWRFIDDPPDKVRLSERMQLI